MPDVFYQWEHNDGRGVSVAIVAGVLRAQARNWPASDNLARADLRALLGATMYMVDSLSTMPASFDISSTQPDTLVMGERPRNAFSTEERAAVASLLLNTWRILAVATSQANVPPVPSFTPRFRTVGGSDAAPLIVTEAGFAWPVAAFMVAGAVLQAAVVCYCADKVATVIDNELSRREATKQMVATQASVLSVLADHKAKEEAAGKELPLGDAAKTTISALTNSQVEAQKGIKGENSSLFPDMKGTGKTIAGAFGNLGFGALLIAGLIAYSMFSKGK